MLYCTVDNISTHLYYIYIGIHVIECRACSCSGRRLVVVVAVFVCCGSCRLQYNNNNMTCIRVFALFRKRGKEIIIIIILIMAKVV